MTSSWVGVRNTFWIARAGQALSPHRVELSSSLRVGPPWWESTPSSASWTARVMEPRGFAASHCA